jgi:hypothetical protein
MMASRNTSITSDPSALSFPPNRSVRAKDSERYVLLQTYTIKNIKPTGNDFASGSWDSWSSRWLQWDFCLQIMF